MIILFITRCVVLLGGRVGNDFFNGPSADTRAQEIKLGKGRKKIQRHERTRRGSVAA